MQLLLGFLDCSSVYRPPLGMVYKHSNWQTSITVSHENVEGLVID